MIICGVIVGNGMGVQRVLCMSVPHNRGIRLKGRKLANSAIENRMTGIGQEAE